MIDRQEAERVAAAWARRESVRRGYECTPMLVEFDLGYVVWQQQPAGVVTVPGDLTTTVIDRDTGELTSWPALPPAVVQDEYRSLHDRPRPTRTADPTAELRRSATRAGTPATAAHLTTTYGQFVARGAKGDQDLRHHPLVRDYLDDLPAGHLTRGGDRHAELIVVSDALHALDLERAEPLSQEDARAAFAGAQLQAMRVREPGDPEGGRPARPCESCLKALVYFGVLEWPVLAFAEESRPPHADDVPDPGRFPPPVADAMVAAGWRPRAGADALAAADVAQTTAVPGLTARHQPSPAAERVLTAYRGLVTKRGGPGEAVWIRRFTIRAFRAAHTADPLADLGRLIGTTLFPIGTENDDAILAVDPGGRVFALDQAGEWFIGPDIDAALTNLLLGRPAPRIRDDGTW